MEPKNIKAIKNIMGCKDGILLQFADGTFDILAWEVIEKIEETAVKYHDKLINGKQILN